MKKKASTLGFKIQLSVFVTWAKMIVGFIRRDMTEFLKYGINEEKLRVLEEKVKAYADIPTDEELLGIQILATQEKDAQAEILRSDILGFMTRAENKFGLDSGKYRKFGSNVISALDGGMLSYTCRRVHRVATEFLPELEGEGLTSDHLNEFKTKMAAFDIALTKQEDAISTRDIATENRTEKANDIYNIIVKYCETGKRIWGSTHEAKYNDYVIYDTPSGTPEVQGPAA